MRKSKSNQLYTDNIYKKAKQIIIIEKKELIDIFIGKDIEAVH